MKISTYHSIGIFALTLIAVGSASIAVAGPTRPSLLEPAVVVHSDAFGEVVKSVVGRSTMGTSVEKMTLTHHVDYADIDISTYTGAVVLKRRVKEAAWAACRQLEELYPLSIESRIGCVRRAIAGATEQVNQAIEAAERRTRMP